MPAEGKRPLSQHGSSPQLSPPTSTSAGTASKRCHFSDPDKPSDPEDQLQEGPIDLFSPAMLQDSFYMEMIWNILSVPKDSSPENRQHRVATIFEAYCMQRAVPYVQASPPEEQQVGIFDKDMLSKGLLFRLQRLASEASLLPPGKNVESFRHLMISDATNVPIMVRESDKSSDVQGTGSDNLIGDRLTLLTALPLADDDDEQAQTVREAVRDAFEASNMSTPSQGLGYRRTSEEQFSRSVSAARRVPRDVVRWAVEYIRPIIENAFAVEDPNEGWSAMHSACVSFVKTIRPVDSPITESYLQKPIIQWLSGVMWDVNQARQSGKIGSAVAWIYIKEALELVKDPKKEFRDPMKEVEEFFQKFNKRSLASINDDAALSRRLADLGLSPQEETVVLGPSVTGTHPGPNESTSEPQASIVRTPVTAESSVQSIDNSPRVGPSARPTTFMLGEVPSTTGGRGPGPHQKE